MAVPYTFGTATASIPLSNLDSNFATTITLGNTAIQLGNTVTTLNNMTLANVTVSSGNVTFTNVSATTANVTTANITTAVIGTATITTAGITTANVTTANVTTGIITTANVTTGNVATLVTTSVTNSGLTTGRVVYTSTGGLETSSANLLYSGTDLTVYGLTVGRGAGAVSTNTAVGASALTTNSTGASNTAIGQQALQANTTASNNTAIGYQAGYSNTTGTNNTILGYQAGYTNTVGAQNTFVGNLSGNTTTGGNNTYLGYSAGQITTTGTYNTFLGRSSGESVTTGSKNVIVGSYNGNAAPISQTGSNYIVLSDGDGNVRLNCDTNGLWLINRTSAAGSSVPGLHISGGADTTSTNYTFYTVYSNGTQAFGLKNDGSVRADGVYNKTSAGVANVNVDSGGLLTRGTSALKYKQDIRNLELIDINKFRPVRYKSKCEMDDQTIDHFGIIADEVDEANIKELVFYGNDNEIEGFKYERLTVVILKALQELKAEFDAYKSTHP